MTGLIELKRGSAPRTGRIVRLSGLLCALAIAAMGSGCALGEKDGPTNAELWEQFYDSRLDTLEIMDGAFNTLGQEYYRLDIEYESIGRNDLARLARRKAKAYHQQHLAIQRRIVELREVNARIARGESPVGMVIERVDVVETREAVAPRAPAVPATPAPVTTPVTRAAPPPNRIRYPAPAEPAAQPRPSATPLAPVNSIRRPPAPTPIPRAPSATPRPLAPQLQP